MTQELEDPEDLVRNRFLRYEVGRAIEDADMTQYMVEDDGMLFVRHPSLDALVLRARSCMASVELVVPLKEGDAVSYTLQYTLEYVRGAMENHDKYTPGCDHCPVIHGRNDASQE